MMGSFQSGLKVSASSHGVFNQLGNYDVKPVVFLVWLVDMDLLYQHKSLDVTTFSNM